MWIPRLLAARSHVAILEAQQNDEGSETAEEQRVVRRRRATAVTQREGQLHHRERWAVLTEASSEIDGWLHTTKESTAREQLRVLCD
jgi:hypothetical protein